MTEKLKTPDPYAPAREAMKAMVALLDDPHHGLVTWHEAVGRSRLVVLEALGMERPHK